MEKCERDRAPKRSPGQHTGGRFRCVWASASAKSLPSRTKGRIQHSMLEEYGPFSIARPCASEARSQLRKQN